ncbi:MAG: peptidoglycan-associated lipoprotein Pal [Alphaproteobacteria bacterium]
MQRRLVAALSGILLLAACGTSQETQPVTGATGVGTAPPAATSRDVSTAAGQYRPGSQEELAQTIGDRLFFGFDRHDLDADGRRMAQAWAGWLRKYPNVGATIEGHADERGTREYNLALGERRANSVRDFLTAQGISPQRLRTISYGKERPAVLGSNEQAWAQNRRGVLTVN